MLTKLTNDLLQMIEADLSVEQLRRVSEAMSALGMRYEVKQKEMSLVLAYGLPQLVKIYLVCRKIEGLSDATLYNYRKALEAFFSFVQKEPPGITSGDIRGYLYTYQQNKNISNRSLDKIRNMISAFFTWAVNEEYLEKNPSKAIKPIKFEAKPRQALTQIELEYIRQSLRDARERAIVETLYSTGCRVSELVGLKLEDVDMITRQVHLFGKGKKHRTSYINAKMEVALQEYLRVRRSKSEYLFVSNREPHRQLKKEAVEKIIRQISERVSEQVHKKIIPHVFRHTTATVALQNGMPVENVSRLLGHANIATTMIYAEVSTEAVKAAHKRYII